MAAYVVKSWMVQSTPNERGNYVEIQGRAPGLVSWLLAMVGIEATISLSISDHFVTFEAGSWGGRFTRIIPLEKVASIFHGYAKPWQTAAALFVVIGMFTAPFTYGAGFLLGIVVGLVYYYLNKTLTLGIFEIGGIGSRLDIKRSVIEGKKLDETDAENVCSLLQALVLKKNQ